MAGANLLRIIKEKTYARNLQTFKPSNLQTFKPSNLQTFKPSKLLILLLAALAFCLLAGCGFSEDDSSSGSSASNSVSISDLNGTTWVATVYESTTNAPVTATLTFSSATYRIGYSMDGTEIGAMSGNYSIDNYSSYSLLSLGYTNSNGRTSDLYLYYYTTYMQNTSGFSADLTYNSTTYELDSVRFYFTPQTE